MLLEPVSGVMQITDDMGPIPPHWMVYFGVDDVDAATAKAQELGGSVVVSPMDIPDVGREIGRFAGLKDPQGAMFFVFKPAG